MPVSTEIHDRVMLIQVDNPPVNALGQAVRDGVMKAIAEAQANSAVATIVIVCAGRTFFAGADIREFGKPPLPPRLPDVCDAIESSAKPVVAAIHGTALGGGLELALSCHYRIATRAARFGLPEVRLGLIPGAGGTQRLPRLVGMAAALPMVVTGIQVTTEEAAKIGLIDRLAEDTALIEQAMSFAREVAGRLPPPRTGERALVAQGEIFAEFKRKSASKLRGQSAPQAAIAALMAAVELPLDQGLARERELFAELMAGPQSHAQRYSFFAERQAAKIDGLPEDTTSLPVRKVGIIGSGTMGGGIAMNFLAAGIPVVLLDQTQEALDRGIQRIVGLYDASVARGRITPAERDAFMERLQETVDYDDLADCDLAIEAVFEDMAIKKVVFAELDRSLEANAILATNTSYLDIDELAANVSHPDRVLGLHFFSPANVMNLLEVVRGKQTSFAVLKTALELARTIGKIPVVAGVCDGFIGNRMMAQRRIATLKLVMDGVRYDKIDEAHVRFGMPMGPFQMSDLAGLDVGWHRDAKRIENLRDTLCAAGRFGQKSGQGYYNYDEMGKRSFSPEVQRMIGEYSKRFDAPSIEMEEEEIIERTLYPIVNEGTKLIEEGIVQRASDIDVVWINGYGWPSYRGGPMYWADQIGLRRVADALAQHGIAVSPLLERLAGSEGKVTS